MLVIGIIPARMDSIRFPGKPLAMIAGKPMIQWVAAAASRAMLIDKVLVATDDERICAAAHAANIYTFLSKRPFASGTERVAAAAEHMGADIVINIQGDEPLIEPGDLDMLVRFLACPESEGYDIASLFYRGTESQAYDPNFVKLEIDPDDIRDRMGLKHEAVRFSRRPVEPVTKTLIHIGVYAFRAEFLVRTMKMVPTVYEVTERLEQYRWLDNGARMMMFMARHPTHAVNTPGDIERVERIIAGRTVDSSLLAEYNGRVLLDADESADGQGMAKMASGHSFNALTER